MLFFYIPLLIFFFYMRFHLLQGGDYGVNALLLAFINAYFIALRNAFAEPKRRKRSRRIGI